MDVCDCGYGCTMGMCVYVNVNFFMRCTVLQNEHCKLIYPYIELVDAGVNCCRKATYTAESLHWQCKALSCLCKLQHGRPEQR